MSGIDLRDRQLLRCCDVLAAVEPDAATLCPGWAAHDLAIHLWLIKHEPLAWVGMVVPPLASLTRHRAALIRRRWSYRDLVDRLRSDSASIACMPLDRWEDHRHALGEYYVHTQDVARANGVVQPPPDDALQDALWLRARTAARILRRGLPAGLVIERPDGRRALIGGGHPRIVVTGAPTELICWVYGRQAVAAVTVSGE
ncbi:MAG: maleylpyruvate isomerase family mycothiol-dependent enzyme [Nakamurella sp.]